MGTGDKGGYSLSQKRIPPLKPPEKGLIGSLDLEGVRRLRNATSLRGGLAPLAAIGSAIRFDLLLLPAAALPILQKYSLIPVYR